MVNVERYHIERRISSEDLDRLIRKLEMSTRVLKRLYFVRYRYDGITVEEASSLIGITKMMGYEWQNRWNALGYSGLIPRYKGKGPSKLSPEQRERLRSILQGKSMSTAEVRTLIRETFDVEYSMKQVWSILRGWRMHHAKPYVRDKRRPDDAEDRLKKT